MENLVIECLFTFTDLENSELESMALHETQDSKVFQRFKEYIANEPEQVSCSDVIQDLWDYQVLPKRVNAFLSLCLLCG